MGTIAVPCVFLCVDLCRVLSLVSSMRKGVLEPCDLRATGSNCGDQ